MGFLSNLFKKKRIPEKQSLPSPRIITFEYAKNNPYFELLGRHRYVGSFFPLKQVKPFNGFKAKTINDVESIRNGPTNNEITIKNITEYIEEPCIPVFLKLQELGTQTTWADANSGSRYASIKVIKETLSEENINLAKANGLKEEYDGFELSFPINKTDTVEEVSNKFLELSSIFIPQSVLYGQQTQSEFLNEYSRYDGSLIAKVSNVDESYIKDHLEYLLKTFPQYIFLDDGKYICNNMPDELFQREILDRELWGILCCCNPRACVNGVVWASRELYDINENNTKQILGTIQNNSNKGSPISLGQLFELMLQEAQISDNPEEVLAMTKRVSFMDSYKICDYAENVKLADEPESMRWLEDGIIRNKDLVHIYEFMFLMVDSGVKNFNLKRFENIIIESKNPKLMCYCIGFVPGIDFNRMLNALYETKCAKYIERLGDEEFGLDVKSLSGYHKKLEAAKKYDYFPESLSVFGTRDVSSLISGAIESKNPYLINEVADYIEYLEEYKDVIGLDITPLENAQLMYADPLHLYEFAASVKSSNKIAFQNRVIDFDMPKYMYYMYEYVPGVNRGELKKSINRSGNKKYMDKAGISK